MKQVNIVGELREIVSGWKQTDKKLAFIPTMGNLHSGHLALLKNAQKLADRVIVSIFVNPMQFDDNNDLAAYPRTIQADLEKLSAAQCDLVFSPKAELMYLQEINNQTSVIVPGNDEILCGLDRPGHFTGVATVVMKLFNMVQADIALFGEKDYQQLLLIKKMVRDLDMPIEVIGVETQRETDGLAMSSRNQYLTKDERQLAANLYQTLIDIKAEIIIGNDDYVPLQNQAIEKLKQRGFTPEYVEVRCASDLRLAEKTDTELRILAAARLGSARLIDNIACNLA